MGRLAVVLLVVVLLAGCAPDAGSNAVRDALATPTPGELEQALANIQAQATLDSIQATSQVISAGLTLTAGAPTQRAAETATGQAWIMQSWTATAAADATQRADRATGTAGAWTPTPAPTATPDYTATVDAAAAAALATTYHGQAVSVELAISRERMMNEVQAVVPWVVLVVVVVFVLAVAWRWARVRPIRRDERGDAPLLVVDGAVYDADRNPEPVMNVHKGKPHIPMLTDRAMQAATTGRDQLVDLATRGQNGPGRPPRKAVAAQMGQLPGPVQEIRVLRPEEARPLLGDVIPSIARDAIDGELGHEEVPGND